MSGTYGSVLAVLLGSAIKGTVVLAAAYLCAGALRGGSAAMRHLVWTAAIAAVVLLPLLSVTLPGWPVGARSVEHSAVVAAAPTAHEVVQGMRTNAKAPVRTGWPGWPVWVVLAWAAGALAVLARMAAGMARVWWVARRSREVEDREWKALLQELSAALGLRRRVRLVECERAAMPMTWGAFRPAILLPRQAREWPAERRRLVLAHELIHVQRLDHWSQMLAQAACAWYWFHPLIWRAASEFRKEREQSCDDGVLRLGTKGSAYAEHLLELARSLQATGEVWSMAVGMAHASHLESRLLALLDPRRNRQGVTPRRAVLAGLAAAALTLPLAAIGAQATAAGGILAGTVYDASGAVVPDAAVKVTSADGSSKEITRTNAVGEYSFAALAAGSYTLEVAQPGFKLFRQTGVAVNAGQSPLVNATLNVGAVSETLDVVGNGKRPPIPSKPGAAPQRIRVGGNVQATKLIYQAKPAYPVEAQQKGVEGTVLLQAVVWKDGSLGSVEVMNKLVDPTLASAAMDAVKQWRYEPTLLNGEPVEVVTTITVNFRLGQ